MKRHGAGLRLSASDLMQFMSCTHASFLDLEPMHGRGPEPVEDSEDAALFQKRGDAHEAAHLEALKAAGDVVEIDDGASFDDAVRVTKEALDSGARSYFKVHWRTAAGKFHGEVGRTFSSG